MANNPLNLAFRFLLEMTGLVAVGVGVGSLVDGPMQWPAAIGAPIALAVVWGTFNVPDDPSRGGSAPVPVHGAVRLLIELGFFATAVVVTWAGGMTAFAAIFGLLVVVHYALSWDRIRWLLE